MKRFISLAIVLLAPVFSFSQNEIKVYGNEVLVPLRTNAHLKPNIKKSGEQHYKSSTENSYFLLDTLSLPFIDDFSLNFQKNYLPSLYPVNIPDSSIYDFTIDGSVVNTFVCYFDTSWSYVSDTAGLLISQTEMARFEVVYFNDPYNPFIPSDTDQCWLPYSVYDTTGGIIPDTLDTIYHIGADTLINQLDTILVYPPDTLPGGISKSLWIDNYAYINSTYPIDPITIGVATLDGVDETGAPYNDFADPSGYGVADQLTSKPIDLKKTSLDSVFLSFYYQPEGLGNDPQDEDSLVLEFFAPLLGEWHHIWSTPGKVSHDFKQVMIQISNTSYLEKGFQFRFNNYATISGNLDHWHIDYIRLDENRNEGDTLILLDIAHVYNTSSLLKNYTAMPWDHFLVDTISQLADSLVMIISNNDPGTVNLNYEHQINTPFDSVLINPIINNLNVDPQSQIGNFRKADQLDYLCYSPYNGCFDPAADSVTIEIRSVLNVANDPNRNNDTLKVNQSFYNYYAYDDGSAEAAYGLNVNGGKLAYRFTVNKADTLRAISMYFSQVMEDVSEEFFYLTIWSGLNPEQIVFQKPFLSPIYADSLNKFHTYLLDTAIVLSGTYYIGWIQTSPELLNIGFDKNHNASGNLYYNVSGTWLSSIIEGAVMIRPLFGKPIPVPVGIHPNQSLSYNESVGIRLYPNPATDVVYWEYTGNNESNHDHWFRITDICGRIVKDQIPADEGFLDISHLNNGIYLIEYRNGNPAETVVEKLFISR